MIQCKNCNHENIPGTLFCTECGAQLESTDEAISTKTVDQDQIVQDIKEAPPQAEPPSSPLNSWLSLHLMDSSTVLPLPPNRNEYTMGRLSEGQPILPDVDLMPYQAYAAGVSRLHAVIKRMEGHVYIMDLGSSNGTYLNGRRINPHTEEVIRHGDVFALGKLKIQALIRSN